MRFIQLSTAIMGSMLLIGTANADQVILDDLIVDGSACVGQDCVNGESFGFDTIRLKENNLRIKFQDTSNSASFPTNDWQLTANDSTNGGQNKFSIDDIDGGRTPFTIEASAPSHSLYVDDGGRIGLGTSTPVVELHVKDGDTPTLRLEQDGSSGFTPQTWDLAGNETNIFIRDVTNGSTLPFRIRPSAPTSSIDISGDGDVGVGTSSPSVPLHVRRTNGTASMFIEEVSGTVAQRDMISITNNGGPRMVFTDSDAGAFWRTSVESDANNFVITRSGTGVSEFLLDNLGNLTLNGTLTITGGCSGCVAVFSPEYVLKSIEEHANYMWENKHLPAVGPTADLPEKATINVFQKTTGILNELETAHIYITQLNDLVKQKESRISELSQRLEKIEQALDLQ